MGSIQIRNVTRIFGRDPKSVLPLLRSGASKELILEKTGHAVGLRDVSLTMEAGRIFVVMGLSGSGKSTLIRHVNRLIEPTAGEVLVDGTNVTTLPERELREFRRRRMAMVFQKFGLLPHQSVLANVAYGLGIQGLSRRRREERARHWIEAVGLAGYEKSYPRQLSGGMQQRVGLARALTSDTDILLMDEAFSALDPLIRTEMQDQLIRLQQDLHKTIVFITHDLDEALRLGDKVAILRDGEVVQVGTPQQIVLDPADGYVRNFVKDVDRSKVLTAEAVMAPLPEVLDTTTTLEDAIAWLENNDEDYAYVTGPDRRLAGIVTTVGMEKLRRQGGQELARAIRPVESVRTDRMFAECLDLTVSSKRPVPVVDGNGRLAGILSPRAMMRGLIGTGGFDPHRNGAALEAVPPPSRP
ncbi:MAG TPA: glycine betaine/L-proline ABC transporter ATP-binding protein [Arenibaculum sp.]|nr:glycine betaine/L-proline ABC transporter ATP-binding protein [Arenibaculum sp.]